MKTPSIQNVIMDLALIRVRKYGWRSVFVTSDFVGLIDRSIIDSYKIEEKKLIASELRVLVHNGRLREIQTGYYDIPVYCRRTQDYEKHSDYELFLAVLRKHGHIKHAREEITCAWAMNVITTEELNQNFRKNTMSFIGCGRAIDVELFPGEDRGITYSFRHVPKKYVMSMLGDSGPVFGMLSYVGQDRAETDPAIKSSVIQFMKASSQSNALNELTYRTGNGVNRYAFPAWMVAFLKPILADFDVEKQQGKIA